MTGEFGRELAESPGAAWIERGLEALGFKPTLTSVSHGKHAPGSEHYHGRAVDLGLINGVAPGDNETTWDFLTKVIAAGGPRNIGVTGSFAQNPELQKWARAHNVNLFQESPEKTGSSGPHIHLGV